MTLPDPRPQPQRTSQTFRFLGFVVAQGERRVGRRTLRRITEKARAVARRGGEGDVEKLERSLSSSLGSIGF